MLATSEDQVMEPITVYTTGPQCQKCNVTKMMLKGKGIPFVEVNITENANAREYVVEDLGYTVAPVVVVDEQDHWCDVRPDQIERIAKMLTV